MLGAAEEHALLYVEEDLAEGSLGAAMFHAALTAGYHLLEAAGILQTNRGPKAPMTGAMKNQTRIR